MSNYLRLGPGTLNGKANAGDDIRLLFTFTAMNLNGCHARLAVSSSESLSGVLTTLSDEDDPATLTITPATDSTITGWVPASLTGANLYEAIYYGLVIVDASGKRRTYIAGKIDLEPNLVPVV